MSRACIRFAPSSFFFFFLLFVRIQLFLKTATGQQKSSFPRRTRPACQQPCRLSADPLRCPGWVRSVLSQAQPGPLTVRGGRTLSYWSTTLRFRTGRGGSKGGLRRPARQFLQRMFMCYFVLITDYSYALLLHISFICHFYRFSGLIFGYLSLFQIWCSLQFCRRWIKYSTKVNWRWKVLCWNF